MDLSKLQYVQARNYHHGRLRPIRAIVIHDMEAPETTHTALDIADYFAGGNAPDASSHFCVDSNHVIACVRLEDTAWAAPGLNADGIQIENAGYASQKRSDWLDPYSVKELTLLAKLVATLSVKYGIPVRRLTVAQVKDGASKGICGHIDVTNAFPDKGTGHTDPGPNFPWDVFLQMVAAEVAALQGKTWNKSRIGAVATLVGVPIAVFLGISQTSGPVNPPHPKPTPTVAPTVKPTVAPTVKPTVPPTVQPTTLPTVKPTPKPSPKPTPKPTPTTITPSPRPTPHPGPVYYVVRKGDSLWSIAQRYHLTVSQILALNSTIYPGQRLRVK